MLNLKVNQRAVPSRGALKLLRNTVILCRLALMQLLSGQQRVGCGHSRGETLTPAKPSLKKKTLVNLGVKESTGSAIFRSTYTKIRLIWRRSARLRSRDEAQIPEVFRYLCIF